MNAREGWTMGHMSTPRWWTTPMGAAICVCDLHVYHPDQSIVFTPGVDMSPMSTPYVATPRPADEAAS